MKEFLVIGLYEHRIFGRMFLPYIAVQRDKPFISVIKQVSLYDLKNMDILLSEKEMELIKLTEQYSDSALFKLFSKKQNIKDFYTNLDPDLFEKRIKPYIEKRIAQCLDLLLEMDMPLYVKGERYNNLYTEDLVRIHKDNIKARLSFIKTDENLKYHLSLKYKNEYFSISYKNIVILSNEPCWILHGYEIYYVDNIDGKKLTPFLKKEEITVPASSVERYMQSFVLQSIKKFDVQAQGFKIKEEEPKRQMILKLSRDLKANLSLQCFFRYGEQLFHSDVKRTNSVTIHKNNGEIQFLKFKRNLDWEEEMKTRLTDTGLKNPYGNFYTIAIDDLSKSDIEYTLLTWLNRQSQFLKHNDIVLEKETGETDFFTGEINLRNKVDEKTDWFEVRVNVEFGEYSIPLLRLRNHILNGIREFVLPNGQTAIIPEDLFSDYRDILQFGKKSNDEISIKKHHFELLDEDKFHHSSLKILRKLAKSAAEKSIEVPYEINANLRNYQKDGFSWMMYLNQNNFGGCLADDMGLGKTLQTLCLLAKAKREEKGKAFIQKKTNALSAQQLELFGNPTETILDLDHPVSLIVMPASLTHNWENEIRKFTPHLRFCHFSGIDRAKSAEAFCRYDIVLTTYGIVRNETRLLKECNFHYIILDESQYIKNPDSKIYKAITSLNSKFKLVLTGTPIENSLTDLWSQMNFVNKGLLGSLAFFRKEFVTPIEKYSNEKKEKKLRSLIKPFVLRRTKSEVASDLPPLSEQVLFCDMHDEQQRIYNEEKASIRNSILENIETIGLEKSTFLAVQGLTRLRQLANHPRLIDKEFESGSGKFELVLSHLEDLKAQNHQVLIFSSFVKYLNLLKEELTKRNWQFAMLTGETSKRKEEIDFFQKNSHVNFFLISLKAGGVGLNLTAADYVFILDPWWNPASENQAINRAHRIGQDKHVMVYKFISKNSIEEKIIRLQEKKSNLAESFQGTSNPLGAMNREELEDLFK